MSEQLGSEDGQAVDIVLQRDTATNSLVKPASQAIRQRVECVEHVLNVLGNWPAADPPEDLIQRTLRRAEQTPPIAKTKSPQSFRRSTAQ